MSTAVALTYKFLDEAGGILNSRQSPVVSITGNIYDWFYLTTTDGYVPLSDFLLAKWDRPVDVRKHIIITYELNGPIRFLHEEDLNEVRDAWCALTGISTTGEAVLKNIVRPASANADETDRFGESLSRVIGSPTAALEFLRQLCLASRTIRDGAKLLKKNLVIIIEGADMIIPQSDVSRLSEADRTRISICRDWFCDAGFLNARDSVVLLTESKSKISQEIARLPQFLEVAIDLPDNDQRLHFINWFIGKQTEGNRPQLWTGSDELATLTAGLTTLAIMQMLRGCAFSKKTLQPDDVVVKVEAFIESQLGEGVVEFKRPSHTMNDVVGNTRMKKFISEWFVPRLKKGALSGATVGGAIGAGKSYIFEAVASELGIPVLILKNIRSMWFGETDTIFERLLRILYALHQVLLFVDEADTQFGGVGKDVHETERRLTGKFQNMMADPKLRGRVFTLLITARINLLSKDMLREGRAGDIIFPILDPIGDDRKAFLKWVLQSVVKNPSDALVAKLDAATKNYYAAAYSSLRASLKAEADIKGHELSEEEIFTVVMNKIPPDTQTFRRIQTLHALLNCTDRRLLPEGIEDLDKVRDEWRRELNDLTLREQ